MVKIDSTSFGELLIDGKTYYSDMTVWWDGRVEYRGKSHQLDMSEFVKLLQRKPEAIVIGTGQSPPRGGLKILPEVLQMAEDRGIEIFSDLSPKAIQIFNGLLANKKKVVAVIHTTC
jgi:hypothetical protein